MNRFNLTFWGEILPGKDPEQVKARFAKLFDITDPERLEHFFTGETITLRRNLDRKVAGEYYHKLHKLGVEAELVKVTAELALPETDTESGSAKSDWETARRQAELEALQRRNKDVEQRRQTLELARQREADEAARREAAELKARQEKEEQAARQRAEAEIARKREADEAAREQAEKQRLEDRAQREKEAAIEAARVRAAELEARLLREQEEARREAEAKREEQRRAEEAARRKAEQEAERKRKAEEAARRKAEQEAERKRKAEEAARLKAEREAEKERKAEEAARKKAAAAEARRIKAEQAAAKKAAAEQKRRQAAEEAARKKSEEEQKRKLAAQHAAKIKAEKKAESERRAAEAAKIRAEKIAQEKQRAQAEAARLEVERQQKAEAEARRKAQEQEARRQQREAERAEKARQAEAQRKAEEEAEQRARELEEKAIERGAEALADTRTIKVTPPRVKSRLELPRRNTAYHSGKATQSRAAPNLYRLRAFRNTAEVRERPAIAREKSRQGLLVGAGAIALLLILLGRFVSLSPAQNVSGPLAVSASQSGQLTILAGNQLLMHDRAGVSEEEIVAADLGFSALSPPLAHMPNGDLLLKAISDSDPEQGERFWQCQLATRQCNALESALAPDRVSVHPLTGELFVADLAVDKLAKMTTSGELKASVERPLGDNPVLRLDSGLLFVNSSEGPAISVLRYEDQAFGQQLDEVLLLPPAALEAEQTRVWDFASSGTHWWVTLYNPSNGDSGLYLFDSNWSFLRQLPREGFDRPGQLVNWSNRILLYDKQYPQLLRYSASGNPEVPLTSASLEGLIDRRARAQQLINLGWSLALAVLILIALISLIWAYLQSARALVYKSRPTRGATPLDDFVDNIDWIEAAAARSQQLKHATIAFGVLSVAVVILVIGLGGSLSTLVAAILALCGPLIALQMLLRSEREYLGTWDRHLVLVDHRQLYHVASGARIQYRGPFVLVDDVIVFTGTALLPALDRAAVRDEVLPRSQAGVRVDRKTVLIKLLESQHPIARAGQVVGACLFGGLVVLLLARLPW